MGWSERFGEGSVGGEDLRGDGRKGFEGLSVVFEFGWVDGKRRRVWGLVLGRAGLEVSFFTFEGAARETGEVVGIGFAQGDGGSVGIGDGLKSGGQVGVIVIAAVVVGRVRFFGVGRGQDEGIGEATPDGFHIGRSFFGCFGEEFGLELAQRFGEGGRERRCGDKEVIDQEFLGVIALEGCVSHEHLEEHDAERVDIGGFGEFAIATALFGGHVEGSANDVASAREVVGVLCEASDAKVEDFDGFTAFSVEEEDIFWFEIAVDDAGIVGDSEGFADLFGDIACAFDGESAIAFEDGLEGFAFEVLHDHVGADFGVDGKVGDKDDVFVSEGTSGLCFAQEAFTHTLSGGDDGVEDLDGVGDAEPNVFGAINDSRSAFAEAFDKAVTAEFHPEEMIIFVRSVACKGVWVALRRTHENNKPFVLGSVVWGRVDRWFGFPVAGRCVGKERWVVYKTRVCSSMVGEGFGELSVCIGKATRQEALWRSGVCEVCRSFV